MSRPLNERGRLTNPQAHLVYALSRPGRQGWRVIVDSEGAAIMHPLRPGGGMNYVQRVDPRTVRSLLRVGFLEYDGVQPDNLRVYRLRPGSVVNRRRRSEVAV